MSFVYENLSKGSESLQVTLKTKSTSKYYQVIEKFNDIKE